MNTEIGKGKSMKINQACRILAFSSVVGMALFSGAVLAQCDVQAWDISNGVSDATASKPRYVGQCALNPTAAGQYVEDTVTEASVTDYVVSFYALTKFASGSTVNNTVRLFEADTGGTPITLDARGDNSVLLTTPGGNTTASINPGGNFNGWNHYKIIWSSGGQGSLTVNGGTAIPVTSGSGVITAQRLGYIQGNNPNLANGLAFDQFSSLRSDDPNETDPLCPGDTNDSGDLTSFDGARIYLELRGGSTGGQPDYNGSGGVTSFDGASVYLRIRQFGSPAPCPL